MGRYDGGHRLGKRIRGMSGAKLPLAIVRAVGITGSIFFLASTATPPAAMSWGGAACTWGGSTSVPAPTWAFVRSETAELRAPARVAVDSSGNVYTTDPTAGRLTVRDPLGRVLRIEDGLGSPLAIAVDAQGDILIGEQDTGSVLLFDPQWNLIALLGQGAGEFAVPNDIAIDAGQGRIYVADSAADMIRVYAPDGTAAFEFGGAGNGEGQFHFPAAIHVSLDGEIFVADQNNDRIQVFDLQGGYLRCFGSGGGMSFGKQFGRITGIAGDALGRLYVADAFQGHIKVFDANGGDLGTIGSFGRGPGQLRTPMGLALDPYGRLFVASVNNSRLDVFGVDDFSNPACVGDTDCAGDGDPCTADLCIQGACVVGGVVVESVACGSCGDCLDNDGDDHTDGEDSDCSGLARELPYAVLARVGAPRTGVLAGKRAALLTSPGGGHCGSGSPYPGGDSAAGLCGNRMRIAADSLVEGDVLAASGSAAFGSGTPVTVIHGRFAAAAEPRVSRRADQVPLVGPPERCEDGTRCTTRAQCSAGMCLPARTMSDVSNSYVSLSAGSSTLLQCRKAQQAMAEDAARVAQWGGGDSGIDSLIVDRNSAPTPCLRDPTKSCPTVEIAVGNGMQVLELEQVRLRRGTQLIFSGHPDTTLVVRVGGTMSIDREALVATAGGLGADHVLWSAEGTRRPVRLGRESTMVGTILAPDRIIRLGRGAVVEGALLGQRVLLKPDSKVRHTPFAGTL